MLAGGDTQGKQGWSPSSTEKWQRHSMGKGLPYKLFLLKAGYEGGKKKKNHVGEKSFKSSSSCTIGGNVN